MPASFLAEADHESASLRLHLLADLILHDGGLRPLSSRIFEDMSLIEIHFVHKLHGLSELLLCLPGESHDHIRGQRGTVEILPQDPAFFIIFSARISAVHPLQRGVASALKREMEMRAHLRKCCQRLCKFFCDDARLQRSEGGSF